MGASSPFIAQHMRVFSQLNYCNGSIEAWKKASDGILKVENPVEPWFLLSYLEFTEHLNSVEKQKPFCCPLRLDCLIAKASLAKNQGSEKFQLKSLGLTVAFFFPFPGNKRPHPCQTTSMHLAQGWLEGCCGKPWLNYRTKSCVCSC